MLSPELGGRFMRPSLAGGSVDGAGISRSPTRRTGRIDGLDHHIRNQDDLHRVERLAVACRKRDTPQRSEMSRLG